MDFLQLIKTVSRPIIFDGSMGVYLQSLGYGAAPPVAYNLTNPEVITDIHKRYINAGAEIIKTNTFNLTGISRADYLKIFEAAFNNAKNAFDGAPAGKRPLVALDIGPTGKLTPPMGDTTLNQLYDIYKEIAIYGEKFGADFALIETMQDIGEMRAAVLAVKENTLLPVAVTVTFEKNGRTLFGASPATVIFALESLGINAIGINCGFGMESADMVINDFIKYSCLPVIVQPNAGLPETIDGKQVYTLPPSVFAEKMKGYAGIGARFIGGCCGTTPEHIKAAAEAVKNIRALPVEEKNYTAAASYSQSVIFNEDGGKDIIVGTLEFALKSGTADEAEFEDVAEQALDLADDGAEIIYIKLNNNDNKFNAEEAKNAILSASSSITRVCPVPLMTDAYTAETTEAFLRDYPGKAVIYGAENVNRDVFEPIKKYGAVFAAKSENDCKTAAECGVPEKNIVLRPRLKFIGAD